MWRLLKEYLILGLEMSGISVRGVTIPSLSDLSNTTILTFAGIGIGILVLVFSLHAVTE